MHIYGVQYTNNMKMKNRIIILSMQFVLFMVLSFLIIFVISIPPSEEEIKQLPDLSKPATRKELRCSACRAVTLEIFEGFMKADLKKGSYKYVKEYDRLEILDAVCADVKNARAHIIHKTKQNKLPFYPLKNWGLQRRNNVATTSFSRDKTISMLQGNWVSQFIINMCGEVIGDYDEELISFYKENVQDDRYETHVFVNDICGKKVLKVCKPDDDLLGVEDLFKVKARPVEFAVDL